MRTRHICLIKEFIEGMLLKHEAKRWIRDDHAA